MKIKNIVFLLLVLGVVLVSGCTGFRAGPGAVGTYLGVLEVILRFFLGDAIYTMLIGVFGAIGSMWVVLIIIFILAVIMPWISTYLIVYGFLSELRIFRTNRWINAVLAFTMTTSMFFLPIPTLGAPLFALVFRLLFSAMSLWAILIFTAMFFVGTIYLFKMRRAKWGTGAGVYAAYHQEAKGLGFELKTTNEALAEAMKKMARETNPDNRSALERSIQELSDRRNDLSERIRELDQARRRL